MKDFRCWWLALPSLLFFSFLPATTLNSTWTRHKTPEDAGFKREAIQRIQNHYARSGLDCLFVVYKGHVLLALGDYQRRFPCHSMRKSLMNAVMGILVDECRIDLNARLTDMGIDDLGRLTKVEKQTTVRQLLQSRSGVYHPAVYETASMSRTKPRRGTHPPGSFWHYNNWDFNVLSTIVNQQTNDDFLRLCRTRLAEPLGMEDYREFDGNYFLDSTVSRHPAYGFKLSARDLARFGLLYLQRGLWNGQRILSEKWVEDSTKSYSATGTIRGGYGYLWWIPDLGNSLKAFAACGVGTQVLLVIPSLDLVIVQRVNTFIGRKHPFDPTLYRMIIDAQKGTGKMGPDGGQLPTLYEKEVQLIENKEKFIGTYDAADGTYQVQAYGDGLLLRYPKGMCSYLQPWKEKDTFLVEDIFEVIHLKKPTLRKNGVLHILGQVK